MALAEPVSESSAPVTTRTGPALAALPLAFASVVIVLAYWAVDSSSPALTDLRDDLALAGAGGARGDRDELPEHAPRRATDLTAAAAGGARRRPGARPRAGASTVVAALQRPELDCFLHAGGDFAKRQLDRDPDVLPPPGLRLCASTTEERFQAAKASKIPHEDLKRLAQVHVVEPEPARAGAHVTVVSFARGMVHALEAAEQLAKEGIEAEVIDLRTLRPLDLPTIIESVKKTNRLVTVEENPRLCGWGAEIASIVADECFWDLDGPILRITTPHIPLPSADRLEDNTIPSVERIVREIREKID